MMDIKEIKKALEECPTPWRLRSHPYKKYELDCGGNLGVLTIDTDSTAITIDELTTILSMVEMAPVYIKTLLNEVEELQLTITDMEDEIARLETK